MTTKVHRVVLLIVDHDDIGADRVDFVLENTHYPNRCIAPEVMLVETRTVEWSDAHPLNNPRKRIEAFEKLFGKLDARPVPTSLPGPGEGAT